MANNDMLRGNIGWTEDMSAPLQTLNSDTSFGAGRCLVWVNDSSTNPTSLSINGGAVRIPLGGDGGDTGQVYGPLAFEPDESIICAMQVRFRITDVSVSSVFVGWTDQVAASEVAIEDEDGTLETNATDAVGILLEGEQDGTWQTVGVQNGSDNSQAASTNISDLADSEWTTVRIEIDALNSGSMKVIVDGVELKTANTNTKNFTTSFLRSSIVYAPTIGADDRDASYNLDVAEFSWYGNVGASFD